MPEASGVEVKPMSGNLGAFMNGSMFAGLFGAAVGDTLAETDRAEPAALVATLPPGTPKK